MTNRSLRKFLASSLLIAIVVGGRPAVGDTIFWLQISPVAAAPAPLQLNGAPGSTGPLYLCGSSDTTRVGGFGLDIVSSNSSAFSFTGPVTYGPQSSDAWLFLDSPTTVTAGSVQHLGGAALPGIRGQGFGPGSSVGNTMLLASVGFMAGSGLTLRCRYALTTTANTTTTVMPYPSTWVAPRRRC
jgi:hypothetical protein